MNNPFSKFDDESWQCKLTERFIVVLSERVSTHENVNKERREKFCQKSWNLENAPSTKDAFYLYVMKTALQPGIWASSCIPDLEIPTPSSWG